MPQVPTNIPTPTENLLSEPADRHAAHEDTWLGYYSGAANQSNYRYLFEVYINAVKVSSLAVRPSPTYLVDNLYGVGYGNIQPIISSYVPTDYFTPPAAGARSAITPYIEYVFKVSEVYNDASGNVCGNTVLHTSGTKRAYNASRKYKTQANDVYFSSIAQKQLNKFQTARVSTDIKLTGNENFLLTAFYQDFVGYRLKEYNGAGTLTLTSDVNFTGDCIINFKNPAPGLSPGTAVYKVQLMRNFGTSSSNDVEYTFTLDCTGNKHPVKVVHFMNSLGGYDTAYFRGPSRKDRAVKRQTAQIDGNVLNTSTYRMDRINASKVFTGGTRNFLAAYLEPIKLTTEFLTENEYEFYADLVSSPAVYLEEEINGVVHFIPHTVVQDKIEIKKRSIDGLTVLELELVPGFENYTPSR